MLKRLVNRLSGTQRKLLFLVALPIVVACFAVFISTLAFDRIKLLNHLRVEDLDRAERLRAPATPDSDIEVITFDSNTPAQLGLGQDVTIVPRRYHAELLKRLDKAGAKVALVDVMFSAQKPGDADFTKILNNLKTLRVTLATSYDEGSITPGYILKGNFLPISVWTDPTSDRVRVASVNADKSDPGDLLIGGHALQEDLANGKGQLLYAPLSAALQAHDIPRNRVKLDTARLLLTAGALEWSLDSNCAIRARWTKDASPFKHWNFLDALAALKDPQKSKEFQGKILLIGYKGVEDAHETAPFGRVYGIDFLAQMTNTALLAYNAQFQSSSSAIYYPYCILVGIATMLAFRAKRAVVTVIPILLLATLCVALQRLAASQFDMFLSLTGPLAVICTCAVIGTLIARYWTDAIDLSPPSSSEEATVLFLDIKGSTELLNSIGREKYQTLLDALFPKYTACVVKHSGQIERTLGDGFIAVFRKTRSRHHALRCADCCKELTRITDTVGESLQVKVRVALGFESGIVGGGYVSEAGKEVWSSSGSTVHLAQRLQSLCGQLSLDIAVGPVARRLISHEANCPLVTHAVVKGFEEQVEVSQLIQ